MNEIVLSYKGFCKKLKYENIHHAYLHTKLLRKKDKTLLIYYHVECSAYHAGHNKRLYNRLERWKRISQRLNKIRLEIRRASKCWHKSLSQNEAYELWNKRGRTGCFRKCEKCDYWRVFRQRKSFKKRKSHSE